MQTATQSNLTDLGRFKRAGIASWAQVPLWLPVGYKDYSRISQELDYPLEPKERMCFALTVTSNASVDSYSPPRISFFVSDGIGMRQARLTAFGDTYTWKGMRTGMRICVEGIIEDYKGNMQLNNPILIQQKDAFRVVPKYRGKRGVLAADSIRDKMEWALAHHLNDAVDYIFSHFAGLSATDIENRAGLSHDISTLLRRAHLPDTVAEGDHALSQLSRLSAFLLLHKAEAASRKRPAPRSVVSVDSNLTSKIVSNLPFNLTGDQRKAIADIVGDLESPYPMRRLLSGDVGTGKTYTFLLPALAARECGAKVGILVPNGLLAAQVVREAGELLGGRKPPVALVTSESQPESLEPNPILVGTTALLAYTKKMDWKSTFLICDEQQKFSAAQREALLAEDGNFLEATATCIPRTVAFITHGGQNVSTLMERPFKRDVLSRIVFPERRGDLVNVLRANVDAGGQIAIIYPKVEDDGESMRSATAAHRYWERLYPGRTRLLHGSMSEAIKVETIAAMRAKHCDVLVSTTAIEIGIDMPSLRCLAVADADRFGTSTLHQMRGRVARGGGEGKFFMVLSRQPEEGTLERLRNVEQIDDGFALAEKDMALRGFGDLDEDSERQSGKASSLFFCENPRAVWDTLNAMHVEPGNNNRGGK